MASQVPLVRSISAVRVGDSAMPFGNRKTRIVCTIGPASMNVLDEMIAAGMNVARFNFSHADHKSHAATIAKVRAAAKRAGKTVAILLDTKGPEIRTGMQKGGKIELKAGQDLEIVCSAKPGFEGTPAKISVDYENLPRVIAVGAALKIDDGLIVCRVVKLSQTSVFVKVLNTAKLGSRKGVNLPGTVVDLPALTDRDKADILFGLEQDVDFVAASFMRTAQNVLDIRKLLGEKGKHIQIIPKIENQEGLDNFDEILEVSDGIMVARGDLGVEIPIQRVCMAQKLMIRRCNVAGKPVITATQMLQSMESSPRPTRAEASDVANAVFDGTDCVMLSGESANGQYPVEAIATMAKICRTAEAAIDYRAAYHSMVGFSVGLTKAEAITSSAVKVAYDVSSPVIVVLTETGSSARFVSKYKPHAPVITVTRNARTARQLMIARAVCPILLPTSADDAKAAGGGKKSKQKESDEGHLQNNEKAIQYALAQIRENKWGAEGDAVVVVSGVVTGKSGGTNMMKLVDL